jgi:endonuclease YncB( thermonuclease family)
VISCNDGDTCKIQQGKKLIKVRLAGIDAPETDQEGAEAARKFLLGLIQEKEITLKCIDSSMGRENCSVFVGSTDIQSEMVRAGWAFDYPKYSHGKYKSEQADAKKAGKGVWAFKSISSPYCYRYIGTKECNADKLYQP